MEKGGLADSIQSLILGLLSALCKAMGGSCHVSKLCILCTILAVVSVATIVTLWTIALTGGDGTAPWER